MLTGQSQKIVGAVVFVVSVAAFVALTIAGKDTTELITLVGPVVGGLLVSGHVSTVTDQQNQTIAKIDKQTNGVMDARIRDGVTAVLQDAGVLPGPQPTGRTASGAVSASDLMRLTMTADSAAVAPAADSVAAQADPVEPAAAATPASGS